MSNDERFLGRVYSYDPVQNTIVIKIDFIDPDQQAIIEQLNEDQSMFSFWFKKPFKESKRYHQLKFYFKMLKTILIRLEVFPDSKNIRALDESIKRTCLKCETIQIGDQFIPIIPSKADLDFNTMENLNLIVQERYSKFLDNINIEE